MSSKNPTRKRQKPLGERKLREGSGRVPPSPQLLKWLKTQATKLKRLVTTGWKLQTDYLLNAGEQGKTLIGVRKRLEGTTLNFSKWVEENTDLGVSTAYLWCDVAEWWDDLRTEWNNSNPLESSIRQIRERIRILRQSRGLGKPRSGKRKTSAAAMPSTAAAADENSNDSSDGENDGTDDEEAPNTVRWEREAAKAEAEAARVDDRGEAEPEGPPLYAVTVLVFTESDQTAIYQALLNWSPISKSLLGPKQLRSVSAHFQAKDIGTLMNKLGKALEGNQPEKVRVSIEL